MFAWLQRLNENASKIAERCVCECDFRFEFNVEERDKIPLIIYFHFFHCDKTSSSIKFFIQFFNRIPKRAATRISSVEDA